MNVEKQLTVTIKLTEGEAKEILNWIVYASEWSTICDHGRDLFERVAHEIGYKERPVPNGSRGFVRGK